MDLEKAGHGLQYGKKSVAAPPKAEEKPKAAPKAEHEPAKEAAHESAKSEKAEGSKKKIAEMHIKFHKGGQTVTHKHAAPHEKEEHDETHVVASPQDGDLDNLHGHLEEHAGAPNAGEMEAEAAPGAGAAPPQGAAAPPAAAAPAVQGAQ
jgi:hypothetical protein